MPPAEVLGDWLARAAEAPRAGLRFLDRGERESWLGWNELHEAAHGRAGALVEAGVAPGERVALVFPTGREFFEAFFGVLLAGGVPVPLYPPARFGRLAEYHRRTARMLELTGARLVLVAERHQKALKETLAGAPGTASSQATRLCRLAELPPPASPPALPVVSPDQLALVQFSSGTTREPKPVVLSHRALTAQARLLNGFWPDTAEQRHSGVSWLPLYHDMGLIGCVLPALERPSVLTLMEPEVFVARPALWLRAISRYRATVSPAPNFAYGLCADRIRDEELEGVDLSCWRVALNGAEAVAPAVLRAFCRRFAPWGFRRRALTPVYGLAEAALAVTFSELESPFRSERFARRELAAGDALPSPGGQELVSVGRPVPGFAIELRGEDGAPCPPGRIGRLWIRGPSLMAGYLGQPAATAEVLRDGWLDTGDLGFLHRGELFLTGRAKELVILRGRNLAPRVIEAAVEEVPGVSVGGTVAAGFLPEGGDGEQLVLLVEAAKDAGAEELERLPERCRKAVLAAVGVTPEVVQPVAYGTLPRTSSGKLRRRRALEAFRNGTLVEPRRRGTRPVAPSSPPADSASREAAGP